MVFSDEEDDEMVTVSQGEREDEDDDDSDDGGGVAGMIRAKRLNNALVIHFTFYVLRRCLQNPSK